MNDAQKRTPVIWRVQEPPRSVEENRDYSSCQGYGDMVTVLDHVDRPGAMPEQAFEKVMRVMRKARRGDFLLWAGGDPMALMIVGMALERLGLTEDIYWLRWDRRTDPEGNRTPFGYYTPVPLTLGEHVTITGG